MIHTLNPYDSPTSSYQRHLDSPISSYQHHLDSPTSSYQHHLDAPISSYQPPVPQTLHPKPYILHPTTYTLHPTPYTLNPTPCTRWATGGCAASRSTADPWCNPVKDRIEKLFNSNPVKDSKPVKDLIFTVYCGPLVNLIEQVLRV